MHSGVHKFETTGEMKNKKCKSVHYFNVSHYQTDLADPCKDSGTERVLEQNLKSVVLFLLFLISLATKKNCIYI